MYFSLIGVQLFKKAQRKRIPQFRVIKIMILINDRAIFAESPVDGSPGTLLCCANADISFMYIIIVILINLR